MRERYGKRGPHAHTGGSREADALDIGHVGQSLDLVLVGTEDILVAAAEVGVDLARKEGVLGDVCPARVVAER